MGEETTVVTQRLEELEKRVAAINGKLEILLNYLTKRPEKENDMFGSDSTTLQLSLDGSSL